MKLSDYVANFLANEGVKHVFLISGGAAVHLVDSIARHPSLTYVCTQHEQAAAMAADGYARARGNLGVALTTSGPGATNLLTGVCCSYFDSIPTLLLTGQVARHRMRGASGLRQKGFQETDIVSIFQPVTKYAVQVTDPLQIQYELQKAVIIAREGRPGPVLVDIPDDLQRVEISVEDLDTYHPENALTFAGSRSEWGNPFKELLVNSKRPILIYGAGIRLGKAEKQARDFAIRMGIPVLLTWGGTDLLSSNDPINAGRLGVCGPRGGNFAVQNADLIMAVGTRLNQMVIGGRADLFAPNARKIMVDIDPEELGKFQENEVKIDLKIQESALKFFETCHNFNLNCNKNKYDTWRSRISQWNKQYPICPNEYHLRGKDVDAYVFLAKLSEQLKTKDIVITDAGGNLSWTMQAIGVMAEQRVFSAWNHSPMGYSLPASIGAAFSSGRRVICIIGDGGLMMCLQELATVVRYQLPIKIFIFNNHGHGIQKQTLNTWLDSRYEAVDEKTGLSFPDFRKIGAAFRMTTSTIRNHQELTSSIVTVLGDDGPELCNVEICPEQQITPMLKYGAGLEDLDPKITSHELEEIMSARA
ncbi:thiamine pyrophosphate-binding protein [Candidatus Nitrospira salsa]|nr:MAG: acetolactate synthase [Nitrospirales bacterium]